MDSINLGSPTQHWKSNIQMLSAIEPPHSQSTSHSGSAPSVCAITSALQFSWLATIQLRILRINAAGKCSDKVYLCMCHGISGTYYPAPSDLLIGVVVFDRTQLCLHGFHQLGPGIGWFIRSHTTATFQPSIYRARSLGAVDDSQLNRDSVALHLALPQTAHSIPEEAFSTTCKLPRVLSGTLAAILQDTCLEGALGTWQKQRSNEAQRTSCNTVDRRLARGCCAVLSQRGCISALR